MLKSAQKATRGEGGFTLIELLVVMIIIAILMAVAVPTFLKQKQTAVGTKAKANMKQIVGAIESCATGNVNGTYNAPIDCVASDGANLDEPTVAELLTAPAPGETYSVSGAAQEYTVTAAVNSSEGTTTFTEVHATDGTITKTCDPIGKMCPVSPYN